MTDNLPQSESDKSTENLTWPSRVLRERFYQLVQGAVGNLMITGRMISGESYIPEGPEPAIDDLRQIAAGLCLVADDLEIQSRRPH